ncbi:chromosomal replication initiator protein DnaA [Porphyromonas catoniae]|uniref:Chromosomal replication initiator protein DnaA n=1 Tax=Porphyromonas catoniae ATCC 51270 TaxID=887901 RepID=Z4WZQ7_9PORP|nr:chromosomal replication initiator protein DnaA [Porphyromonas catoniae]EWC93250.1 chromosomal replication initiator protein DnaA [Porphyromonas catoniae ATCC 51270]
MQTPISPSGDTLWQRCMLLLAQATDPQTLQTWFTPIRSVGVEQREDEKGETFDALVLYAPSEQFLNTLMERHFDLLKQVTDSVLGGEMEVVIDVDPEIARRQIARQALSPKAQEYTSHLSADLRFETFYESACNREALRIAEATAARPGQAPLNFLFIYGPSGVGKTHLSQAIGQRAMELHPELRVSYVSSSKFEAQFIRDSLNRGPGRGTFIGFYQQMDLLIIDDIQGLIGKVKTQQAFFDIFNHLYLLGKQIIVTCDVPPIDLKGMETRIMTRIQSAMMLRIDRPDLELRRKILQHRVAESGVELGEECVEFIAENMPDNVRQLEGAIRTLITHSKYSDQGKVDMAMTRRIVGGSVSIDQREITPNTILEAVCESYGLQPDQLRTSSRRAELALPRQVVMYLVKKLTNVSYKATAKLLNRNDHTTVMHGVKSIEGRIELEQDLKQRITEIELKLKGR